MAATTSQPGPGDIACPDPSVHDHDHQNKLSSAASAAALAAGGPERSASQRENPLDAEGRLSSKSAATSLKYAQPQDLPSFPSRGSNANAASAAALLAQDHKMKELWQPEQSAAGSKAAMMAQKDGGKVDLWQPSPSSVGNSAATLAMRSKGLSPQVDRGYTNIGKNNSLLAATKSTQQGRQRAGSLPMAPPKTYPDAQNSGKNALNAATVSHRQSTRGAPDGWNSEANQAARVKNIHMDKEMFGDHPPVEPEVEEAKHKAALRASAVSMAKSMMDYQNRSSMASDSDTSSMRLGSAGAGAESAHRRNQSSVSQADLKEEAMKYIHLQDAAHKLAQERLAKVEKEMEHGKYREHYGFPSQAGRQSRFSIRGRGRKRASSEGGNADSDDEEQARRIRTQMTQLSTAQNTVDDKQKQEDRARLMAAAEKRVNARMHDMDEKVFQETGKVSQSMMDEWEAKARERAEKDREERAQHPGKTHIGGGKWMDKDEIEAIAAARLKPTFDELTATAEQKRQRDEEMRIIRDREETEKMERKMQEANTKEEFKRIKEQDKAAAEREKNERRMQDANTKAEFQKIKEQDKHAADTEKMERKMKEANTKAEFQRIKEQDKAAARKEKEERKAAKRAEKEAEKSRKSEEKRKSRDQSRQDASMVAGGSALAGVVDKAHKDEEQQQKDQVAAGGALAEAMEHSRSEVNRDEDDRDATGTTLAEVAERVRSNEDEQKDESGAVGTDRDVVVAQSTVPFEEANQESKQDQGEVSTEQPKPSKRSSVFGSFKDRFRRKEKEETPATEEPKKSVEETKTTVDDDKHDDGAAAPALGLQGAGLAAAGGIEEEHADSGNEDESKDVAEAPEKQDVAADAPAGVTTSAGQGAGLFREVEDAPDKKAEEDDETDKVKLAGAMAGTAVLGAAAATGAVAGEQKMQEEQEKKAEVSSLSTDEELSDSDDDRDLKGATSAAEHSGAYNFAQPSPAVEQKPDLMRHISTIESSSSSEAGDHDKTESDEEGEAGRIEPSPTMVGEYERREDVPARDTPIIAETVPASVEEPEPASPVSPLGAGRHDDTEKLAQTKDDTKAEEVGPTGSASAARSGAPAPVVKGGPSQEGTKAKQEKEKKDGGVRGFFRKLKNKSKNENKLTKEQSGAKSTSSPATASTTAPPAVVATEAKKTTDEAPQLPEIETSTAKDKEDEFLASDTAAATSSDQQTAIDTTAVSGLGGDRGAESPSSFKRHDAELKDLDDVSSSGADEEEYSRGRARGLADRLGMSKDKGTEGVSSTDEPKSAVSKNSAGEEDQFEEARDKFDESLAPPPAFGGQPKSESPVRETRFQEQL